MAGDVVEGDGLEEELGGVVVLDDDGAWNALLLHLPVEGDAELVVAGQKRRRVQQPLLQARLRAHLAAVAIVCTRAPVNVAVSTRDSELQYRRPTCKMYSYYVKK